MADRNWTDEQLKAIQTKNRRLLVSAAAGSGKTAVLVERIIQRILDSSDPVDADRLLVITFTKAAAAEMKNRIRKRLEDELKKPETDSEASSRLRSQIALIDSASIQTVDSFCMNIVKDHTDELDIDPGFRVAEVTELKLLSADVMEELLERYYAEASEEFISFTEAFGQGTAGNGIDEIILRIFRFAQVTPDPGEWYRMQLEQNDIIQQKEYVYHSLRMLASSYISLEESLLADCHKENGPMGYEAAIISDLGQLEELAAAGSFEELHDLLKNFQWKSLGRNKKNVIPELAAGVKADRDEIKNHICKWQKQFTAEDINDIYKEYELTHPFIVTAVRLAMEYDEKYSAAKRDRNVIDFADLEHFALKVLKQSDEYRKFYKEICVDEYQDTNRLQEELIKELDDGQVFMVGDVKQSIYKFRQAKPEIFMKKYEEFASLDESGEGIDTLINLSRNFRSREGVLEGVNRLFRSIMRKEIGGIDYTPDVELYPGASFGNEEEDRLNSMNPETELLLFDTEGMDADDDVHASEAAMIASRIRELTDPDTGVMVWDGKKYRRAMLSDIVILLRSANTTGDVYLNTLLDAGIRAHCDTNKGYFDSTEVRTMLSVLKAVDNSRKDIPFAAFLKSPIIGMTDDELVAWRKKPEALGELGKYKLNRAGEMLKKYRSMSRYMSIGDLITHIYDDTGYYDYAMSLPAGNVRRANLDKLRQMAYEYATTGYRGLFNFIRYIDKLETYDTDFGEASAVGQNDDAVRIMSIHKSKGLEFPICFVAACDRKFNQMDSNQSVLIDDELGIACPYVDVKNRIRKKTFSQMAVRFKLRSDNIGEELRVLYVAMTRAREKLFLTGTIKNRQSFIESRASSAGKTAFSDILSDSGYLHWILASGIDYKYTICDGHEDNSTRSAASVECIRKYLDSAVVDPSERDRYSEIFDFEYAHRADVNLKNKISISELKKRWMLDQYAEEAATGEGSFAVDLLPACTGQDEDLTGGFTDGEFSSSGGAARGTQYHSVMEKLDYSDPEKTLSALPAEVQREDIESFVSSDLGKQFAAAYEDGRLFRERQFIMGIPARELKIADTDEPVLVQGIIDAFIVSQDGKGCILVDYKTDRVSSEDELKGRYEGQLHYYAIAVEKMRKCKVTRRIIWSFALKRAIEL